MNQLLGVRIAGTGSYLPERVVTNDDLSKVLDTSDEWIRSRTGISQRHFAAEDEAASDMGAEAGRKALEAAGVAKDDVDLVICCTMTPDHIIPSTAALIQRNLELPNAGGFDLNTACTGFVSGMTCATSYVRTGLFKNVLLIASERMTTYTDPTDRQTAVIFADGAGAVLLQPATDGPDVLACRMGMRGDDSTLVIPAGGSRMPVTAEVLANRDNYIKMKGRETFRFAVRTFADLITGTCEDAGVSTDDLKIVVPHQVNQRIFEAAAERCKITLDRCAVNIDRVGNTSGASVPIALDEAVRAGRIDPGDLVLMIAFGAGLSWAGLLLRW
ncbi:MAG: ketoacyl-ACP synthase III [Planctomycetes bacterium]|nr:ketoacyl-ACP synthase III [Planctomycetota bacterium]